MSRTYFTRQGDMVDQIAYKMYGHHDGTTEALYEANYRLADMGLHLPAGMTLTIPDLPGPQAPAPIRLWD